MKMFGALTRYTWAWCKRSVRRCRYTNVGLALISIGCFMVAKGSIIVAILGFIPMILGYLFLRESETS